MQLAQQMDDFSRNFPAIRFFQFHREAKKNVPGRQLRVQKAEMLPRNPLHQIPLHRVLQQFLADHQTQTRRLTGWLARSVVQQEQLATNGPPETKNG